MGGFGGTHMGGFGGAHIGGTGMGHTAGIGRDHFGVARRHFGAGGIYDYGLDCPYYTPTSRPTPAPTEYRPDPIAADTAFAASMSSPGKLNSM